MEGNDPWDATAVTPAGGGCYTATIGPEWMLAMVPQGGLLAAIAARALAAELHVDSTADERSDKRTQGDDHQTGADRTPVQPLRSIHGVFVSPVPAGPVVIDVTVLRRGRSVSQAQATVRAPHAKAGFTALAVFGAPRAGFTFTELAYPEVPDPEGQPSFRDPFPPEAGDIERMSFPFWEDVLEGRPALGTPFWDPSPREKAESATWFRFEQPPIGSDGRLDPYTSLVVADVMPGAVFEKVSPTEDRWFAPSTDLTVHLFGAATPGWLLGHYCAHLAGDGYASVDAAIWDPRGADGPELVAYATQQMFFTRYT
ncbi:MAG: thioesterase family protein [Actinomycetota bacterium]|nr:thioesterase family protein [Actinomycetota bacterium]